MKRFACQLICLLEGLLAMLLLAITVIVVAQVVLRYCFSSSITGANEAITILFIYMSAIGAAAAVGKREHIAITMATDSFPNRAKRWVETLGLIAVALINATLVVNSLGWIRVTGHYLMPTSELPRALAQVSVPIGCGLAVILCLAMLFGGPEIDSDRRAIPGSSDVS